MIARNRPGWPAKPAENIKDLLFERTTGGFAFLVLFLAVLLFAVLLRESVPALRKFGASFLVTGTWDPVLEKFGALPFLYGTVVSSTLALLIAVPLSVGAAIFINEFAPPWLKAPVSLLRSSSPPSPASSTACGGSSSWSRSCGTGS